MKQILLIAFAFFIFCLPAHAQEESGNQVFVPPGSMYENNAAQVLKNLKQNSLNKTDKIPVNNVEISLVHYNYMDPDQFGIMMKLPNVASGCFELSPLEYEASFIDNNYMDIRVKDYRRKTVKTQNVSYDCDLKNKAVTGLVVVSAKDLQQRGIRQIRFSNGAVEDNYDITYMEDSIQLQPASMMAFKAQGLSGADKNKLVYYFDGKAIVALHVPMAQKDDNVAQAVRNLAYRYALSPIFEQEGLDTSGENNVFYFNDPQGKTLSELNDEGYAEFGTIQVARPYDGPQGRQGIAVPLKVFVTRPGTTL